MGKTTANFERFKRHFSQTLRVITEKHGSINQVCSDLDINRQQFSKYLSGTTLPSVYVLQRFITCFDVDSNVFFLKNNRRSQIKERIEKTSDGRMALSGGFYLEYSLSQNAPNSIEIGLWRLEPSSDCLLCYGQLPNARFPGTLTAYSGMVTALGNHFLLQAKSDKPNAIVVLTLSKLEFSTHDLIAVKVAASGRRRAAHEAASLLRYIGPKIDVADVLAARCGLFVRSELDETTQAVVQTLTARSRPEDQIASGSAGY
ncbi:MAG: hypothetical protein KGM42_09900 [Hyphomicrobiales bacterium]|nr:hypothetical protein [Hyphomicrobiales bacterium]